MKIFYKQKGITYLFFLLIIPLIGNSQTSDSLTLDSVIFESQQNIHLLSNSTVRFQNNAMTYLKWEILPEITTYHLEYRDSDADIWESVSVSSGEFIINSLPLDKEYYWRISSGDFEESQFVSGIGMFSTKLRSEPIKVSDDFFYELIDWFKSEDEEKNFCNFIEESDAAFIEKLSFVQVYFFDNEPFINAGDSEELSDWYAPMPANLGGGCLPLFSKTGGCECKVITRGEARPSPGSRNFSTGTVTPTIRQFAARQPGPDRTFVDRVYAGAAKFVSIRQDETAGGMNYELSNLQGSDDAGAVTTLASDVEFYLGCIRGGSFNTNLSEGCDCEKKLTVDYEYASRYHVMADRRFCFCSTGAGAQAEDMTVLVARNTNTGDITTIDAGNFGVGQSCNSSWNPQFWVQMLNVASPIAQFYVQSQTGTGTPNSIQNGVNQLSQGLQNLLTTPFLNVNCSGSSTQTEQVLISGSTNLVLAPNNGIRVSMFNSYYLRTTGYGNYEAEAGIASDYFLIGVVTNPPTFEDECCADKFGAYVVGSLSNPANGDIKIDAPFDIESRKEDVGSTMARFGDWDNYPSVVAPGTGPQGGGIPVEYEFDLLSGQDCQMYAVDDENEIPRMGSGISNHLALNQDEVIIYPTIVENEMSVNFVGSPSLNTVINIIDFRGRVIKNLYSGEVANRNETHSFHLGDLPNGSYVLHIITDKGFNAFKFLKK